MDSSRGGHVPSLARGRYLGTTTRGTALTSEREASREQCRDTSLWETATLPCVSGSTQELEKNGFNIMEMYLRVEDAQAHGADNHAQGQDG